MAKPASGRAPAYTAAGVAGPPARELALPAGIHPGEPNGMGGPAAQGHSPVGAPWDGPRRRSLASSASVVRVQGYDLQGVTMRDARAAV